MGAEVGARSRPGFDGTPWHPRGADGACSWQSQAQGVDGTTRGARGAAKVSVISPCARLGGSASVVSCGPAPMGRRSAAWSHGAARAVSPAMAPDGGGGPDDARDIEGPSRPPGWLLLRSHQPETASQRRSHVAARVFRDFRAVAPAKPPAPEMAGPRCPLEATKAPRDCSGGCSCEATGAGKGEVATGAVSSKCTPCRQRRPPSRGAPVGPWSSVGTTPAGAPVGPGPSDGTTPRRRLEREGRDGGEASPLLRARPPNLKEGSQHAHA